MTVKYFIAKCERKPSKHPEQNGLFYIFPIEAPNQTNAKDAAKRIMQKKDNYFRNSTACYSDWYKNPLVQRITEEEFKEAYQNLKKTHAHI